MLGLLALVLPASALAGWLVSRIESPARRRLAATAALAVIVVAGLIGGPSQHPVVNMVMFGVAVAVILLLTATGVGSILGWSALDTVSNLALTAGMFVRALPVVLLTFLVFFNTYVWLMAAIVSRARLWLALGFLFLIAATFLVSSTLERVRPILDDPDPQPTDQQRLAGTPFEHMPDEPGTDELSHRERANVVFVVASSQVGQVDHRAAPGRSSSCWASSSSARSCSTRGHVAEAVPTATFWA